MKNKIFVYVLVIVLSVFSVTGCKGISDGIPNNTKDTQKENNTNTSTPTEQVQVIEDGKPYKLAFKEAVSINKIKELNGKEVTINGYLATSSPADGSFIFLMNLPYQSCPFCVPNTSQLANTMEVYPKDGQKFEYTGQAVTVTGTMEVAEDGKNFTDNFGYEFGYKIIDAEYHIMTEADMTDKMQSYQKIADSGLMNDLYNMTDYLYLMTNWTEYNQPAFTDIDGTQVDGFWFYPGDMQSYKEQYYAYVTETYWDDLIKKAKELNTDNKLDIVVQMITDGQRLAYAAQTAFDNEAWTTETKYWDELGNEETKYTMLDADTLNANYDAIWNMYCDFVNSYEL